MPAPLLPGLISSMEVSGNEQEGLKNVLMSWMLFENCHTVANPEDEVAF